MSLPLPDVYREWFSDDGARDSPALAEAKARCDVVVGMHPDQATEPIVDFALAAGKPFAIVPCCVFPRENPRRRVRRTREEAISAVPNAGLSTAVGIAAELAVPSETKRQREDEEEERDDKDRWERVETYDQFIRYLQQKDVGIRCAALPFQGRNIVLYHLGRTNDEPALQRGRDATDGPTVSPSAPIVDSSSSDSPPAAVVGTT